MHEQQLLSRPPRETCMGTTVCETFAGCHHKFISNAAGGRCQCVRGQPKTIPCDTSCCHTMPASLITASGVHSDHDKACLESPLSAADGVHTHGQHAYRQAYGHLSTSPPAPLPGPLGLMGLPPLCVAFYLLSLHPFAPSPGCDGFAAPLPRPSFLSPHPSASPQGVMNSAPLCPAPYLLPPHPSAPPPRPQR